LIGVKTCGQTTCSFNTHIGTCITGNFGNNSTVLGAQVKSYSFLDNQVIISDGCGNQRIYATGAGNVLIGPTGSVNPNNARLHVTGNLTADGQGVSPMHGLTGPQSGVINVDWNNGNMQYLQISAPATGSNFINGITGGVYNLLIQATATAQIDWTNVLFPGGTAGTITGTTGSVDLVSFIAGPTGQYYGSISRNFS
jgi:hypothetical protein